MPRARNLIAGATRGGSANRGGSTGADFSPSQVVSYSACGTVNEQGLASNPPPASAPVIGLVVSGSPHAGALSGMRPNCSELAVTAGSRTHLPPAPAMIGWM